MKNIFFFALIFILFFSSCSKDKSKTAVDFINPLIGTGGHGHTYPGATVPFGMVQLSPDTRKDSWDGCSGYHYSDSIVFGFSHTHLSGTGVGDYGDIRLMPMVGELKTEPGYDDHSGGYGSQFDHEREEAGAGYYAVHLNDYNIYVGLTATERAGFHKYLFPKSENAHILIDLKESVTSEKIIESNIQIVSETEVSGLRRTQGWSADQYVYFYAEFSKPFLAFGIVENGEKTEMKAGASGQNLKAWFDFETNSGEVILVKVGISAVDIDGAKNNLQKEIPGWDFKATRAAAKLKWEKQVSKTEVGGGTNETKEVFYTALYHSMLAPNIYSDIDGRYRGHDLKIHHDSSFSMYTVFSLWDTFRTLHPLFTIIERERTQDLINSMLDMYKHDKLLPVWELAANETNCMIGYNSIPVIVDAYRKGIRGFDAQLSLEAMRKTANADQFGLKYYRSKGYIPADKEGESVSKTLEYAYDDWCISEMATMLGEVSVAKEFTQRAQYYKNLYDKETGFFRGKSNGGFVTPFDPAEVNFMLTEANTWQYNFFVPQDINTHIEILGGIDKYEAKLDELFNSEMELSGRHQSDITGLIGQYAHGNEPSHHMAYLYNYVGKPYKSQKLVSQIMNELYSNQPDGLSGNEDCGQMSAWYVMSAFGFYPVTPGSNIYVLGTPAFDSLKINLENGKVFKILARELSKENFYVKSVKYNGNQWTKSYITHDMVMAGGTLEFEMSDLPDESFGTAIEDRPFQKITEHLIIPVPSFKANSKTFENELQVQINSMDANSKLLWSSGKKKARGKMKAYKEAILLNKTHHLKAQAVLNGEQSFIEEATYIQIPAGLSVKIKHDYNSQYTAGGEIALVNTIRGGDNFRTGNWQGYWGNDLEATIDAGKLQKISKIGVGFLQDQNSWIFMPEWVRFEISENGVNYHEVALVKNDIDTKADGGIVKEFVATFKKQKVKFIRVTAKNRAVCPEWHKGYNEPAWIFVDEVWWD